MLKSSTLIRDISSVFQLKAYPRARHILVFSTLLNGSLALSSSMALADNIVIAQPKPYSLAAHSADRVPRLRHGFQEQNVYTSNTLKEKPQSSLLKNIRAAIAAKWATNQLHDLIEAVINNPNDSPPKQTAPQNSITTFVTSSMTFDSNVLRQSNTSTLSDRSKDDFIKQIRAGIAAKWSFKRQVLLIKAVISQYWYSVYKELNYFGRDIETQWNWQIGHFLKGELGYANKTSRGSFSQLNGLFNNLETQSTYFVNGAYEFSNGWFLRGGVTRQNSDYAAAILSNSNLTEINARVGLRYQSPNNNLLGLYASSTDGSFKSRALTSLADNAYIRNELNLEWNWQYSVKTRFEGTAGYMQQRFAHIAARNFSAPITRANLNWDLSEKSSLQLSLWRDIGFVTNLDANFVLNQGIKLQPIWLATPQLKFSLPISYEQQDYQGDPGFVTRTTAAERDKIAKIGLNIDYSPIKNTRISLLMDIEDRTSNNLNRNYQSKAIGLDMQVDF